MQCLLTKKLLPVLKPHSFQCLFKKIVFYWGTLILLGFLYPPDQWEGCAPPYLRAQLWVPVFGTPQILINWSGTGTGPVHPLDRRYSVSKRKRRNLTWFAISWIAVPSKVEAEDRTRPSVCLYPDNNHGRKTTKYCRSQRNNLLCSYTTKCHGDRTVDQKRSL